uniref:DUF4629 domain-containing protein n=1 Tax=Pelusios castaneus TaxID=367368 RepID=A0A8C8S1W0_9SAUR
MGRCLQNFSRPSVPAAGSAWLIPSGSRQPIQANPGNTKAFAYQPPETGLWPEAHGTGMQIQLSNSAAPYPAVYEWGVKGHSYGAVEISAHFPVTLVAQEAPNPARSASPHINHSSRVSPMGHLYRHIQPPANTCLMQRQPPTTSVQAHLSQGRGKQVPLQDWRGAYLCNRDMRSQGSGEMGCVMQRGRGIKVPANTQSEMVLILKAIQPMGARASSSASLYCPVSTQPRDSQCHTNHVLLLCTGGISSIEQCVAGYCHLVASRQNVPLTFPDSFLSVVDTLPGTLHEPRTFCLQAPVQQGGGVKTVRTEMSPEVLAGSQMPQGSQGPPLFPLEIPDINQLMACIDPVQAPNILSHNSRLIGPRQVAGGDSLKEIPLRKHISQETIRGKDPLNIIQSAPAIDSQDGASRPASGKGKSPRKASKQVELPATPLRKTIDQAEVSKLEERKQKRLSNLGNDKGRSTNQGRGKLKSEDKQPGIQEIGKTSQPEQEPFKMPRSHLGLHMLESIQVFHPLGKKLISLGPSRGALQSNKAEASSSSAWPKPLLGLKRPPGPLEDSKSIAYHPSHLDLDLAIGRAKDTAIAMEFGCL